MFTGLVESIGTVKSVTHRGNGIRLSIDCHRISEDVSLGDSISVNGVCLTASGISGTTISFDAVPETVKRTNLRQLKPGNKVNLERALKLGARLGGHIVQGHIDGIGSISRIIGQGDCIEMEISTQPNILKYIVQKGSVAVDGVSLTVAGVLQNGFRVAIIPTTLRETTLGFRRPPDEVNIETDILAKYIEKLLQPRAPEGVTLDLLSESGFI